MPDPADAAAQRDSVRNTFFVAIGVSIVCSVFVAGSAVLLRPFEERQQERYRERIILDVADLHESGASVSSLFGRIEVHLVDLSSGEYVAGKDPGNFDPVAAANDPELSVAIPIDLDIANIKRRAIYAPVYLVRDDHEIKRIILPVYGAGLWSTMYGYLALESDGSTIAGLRFYEHAETPGLGDQVDRNDWRALWVGKNLFDAAGDVRIEVVRGRVKAGEEAIHQVDGLTGATLTGRGVTNLIRYWTGPHGFGPYLQRFRKGTAGND